MRRIVASLRGLLSVIYLHWVYILVTHGAALSRKRFAKTVYCACYNLPVQSENTCCSGGSTKNNRTSNMSKRNIVSSASKQDRSSIS